MSDDSFSEDNPNTPGQPKKAKSAPSASRKPKAGKKRPAGQKSGKRKPGPSSKSPKDQSSQKQDTIEDQPDTSGLGVIMKRNNYYRDNYRSLQRIALVQVVIIVFLILAHFFVINAHQPENRYFATTQDGRLVPMKPLHQPNLSTPALLSWVAQATTEIMTFGFHDYPRRLQESSRYFTKLGWYNFADAIKNKARIIERIEANDQVVTAAPRNAPIILNEGLVNGRYQWTVEIPLKLTYRSGSKIDTDNWLVTLVIVRQPQLGTPNGLGIQQWLARPG